MIKVIMVIRKSKIILSNIITLITQLPQLPNNK